MFKIKKQISKLYTASILGNLSLTGAWVAILAARGYSLVEIGIAETVFHIFSVTFEIPSGVFADVFGRKKMLVVSSIMRVIGSICMINSKNLTMVCAAIACFVESLYFLKEAKRAVFLMTCNSFVGAMDIVLLFFLQAKLPQTGMPASALGAVLFIMELGGIFGAKLILHCKKLRYRWVFVITSVLVLCGILIEHTGIAVLMTLGGFVAACSDDALQVRTDAILQEMFPSEQRATLISMESFTFSMIMIVLSPLAGIVFSIW